MPNQSRFQTYFIKMGPASIEGPTQVPTKITFEFFLYSKRSKPRDSGERMHDRALSPCPVIKGATGQRCLFIKNIVSNSMVHQDRIETNFLQLFAHPDTSSWFSIISGIIFEVSIAAEQKRT